MQLSILNYSFSTNHTFDGRGEVGLSPSICTNSIHKHNSEYTNDLSAANIYPKFNCPVSFQECISSTYMIPYIEL